VRIVSDLRGRRSPGPLGPGQAESEGLNGEVLAFQHSKNPAGLPPSFENAIVAVRVMRLDCRYDVFHDRISIKDAESEIGADTFENFENVVLTMRERVLTKFGFDPGAQFLYDALKLECMKNTFDPILDYLDALRWDGVPRVDDWLVRYCGAADTPFNRAVGRKWLMAGVRRVKDPGCKFDFILVLESLKQGVGKSTALKILAGGDENFSDAEIFGVDKREQQEAVQGVWIYELAELDGLSKSEVTRVKVFLSKTVDSARPAYGRARVDRKRRGIFAATTNESTYLRDTTGNRRFWIVPVGEIDLAGLAADRDQLWAEVVVLEATGEPLVLAKELWADAEAIAASRTEIDPWDDVLGSTLATWEQIGLVIDDSFVRGSDSLGKPEWRVSSAYLLSEVLGFAEDRQNNNHTKRLATIMRGLGWERPDGAIRIGSKVCRGFKKPAKPGQRGHEGGVTGVTGCNGFTFRVPGFSNFTRFLNTMLYNSRTLLFL
jgi:predicted P-loop ATPase